MMRASTTAALALAAAAMVGCGGGAEPELAAGPQTTTLAVNDGQIGSQAGVQIRVSPLAQTSRYSGEATYRPAHVVIRNESGRPLRISYDAFALVDAGGAEEAGAVPIYRLSDGDGGEMPGVGGLPNQTEFRNFEVAAGYAERFPNVTRYEGEFQETTLDAYRSQRAGMGEPARVRDARLLGNAIPEGVVRSGGMVDGAIWFDDVDAAATDMQIRFELIDASTGEEFGEIMMPFDVTRAMITPGTEQWQDPAMQQQQQPGVDQQQPGVDQQGVNRDADMGPPPGVDRQVRDDQQNAMVHRDSTHQQMGATGTIDDVRTLVHPHDRTMLTGREVHLMSVPVVRVEGQQGLWVGDSEDTAIFVRSDQPFAMQFTPGQRVMIMGSVRDLPDRLARATQWNLDSSAQARFGDRQVYVSSERIEPATR